MSKKYEVGGSKPCEAGEDSIAGRVMGWALKRNHAVKAGLLSHPVMFKVCDETAPVSKKGFQRIMFTVEGKTPTDCNLWLNAYSSSRGGLAKATDTFKAHWGEVVANARAGTTFRPNGKYMPTDEELDKVFKYCFDNQPVRKPKAEKKTTTKATKITKPQKEIKAVKGAKGQKEQQHAKISKAA